MNKPASAAVSVTPAAPKSQEKILFEIQPLLLPTILNLENLVIIGFTVIIVIAAVIFHFGLGEFLLVGLFYLLIAIPSFRSIFRAGSTSYILTNRRLVIFSIGIKTKERSIPLEQISNTKCKSSGLQRFYGAGDVIVYMKNLGKPIRLWGLQSCKRRAEQILQAAKEARNQA
jgi:Bacterial PH domain